MDAENWIAIAAVTVAFIGPLVNTWYKGKLDRAEINQLKQPQPRAGRFRAWLGKPVISFLLSVGAILYSLIFLIRELSGIDPITRKTIFNIALYMGLIFFTLMSYLVSMILNLLDRLVSTNIRQIDAIESIVTNTNMQPHTDKEDSCKDIN